MIALVESKEVGRSIDELLETVSASRLSTWLQCRLKFWFRYVQGLSAPASPALHVGKVVHAVLQAYNLARWRNIPMGDDIVKDVFEAAWNVGEGVNWNGPVDALKRSSLALVQTYLADPPVPIDEYPEGVECSLQLDLSDKGLPTLVGVLDLVRAGGWIVDYKTSSQSPNADKIAHLHEMQTTGYSLLYREATGKRESGIELHHLVKLKTPKVVITKFEPATDHQVNRLYKQMESYTDGLQRQDFVPSPGLQCSTCEYFSHCRKWCG